MRQKVLIIGAGGVGSVVARKCAQVPELFDICIASRTKLKCDKIAATLSIPVKTAQLDADNVNETVALIKQFKPELVINVALPYQDLTIMDACLETGVNYLDTANYEPRDTAKFEYHWQWAYHERFKKRGLMALLGSGFDPGVTNVFTSYIARHYLDTLEYLDIVDVNGGDHGQNFATNFNPEINIREVSAPCRHFENGKFIETPPMSLSRSFTCPDNVGTYNIYRMYHEEMESLTRFYPSIKRTQFWMSFSDNYLKYLEVLKNVGMTRIDPISFNGCNIVPLQFLKALLPDPGTLGETTKGKTCIGVIAKGKIENRDKSVYIYNTCDHEACYKEVGAQGVSYTTGVPAMIGAMMMLTGKWKDKGVFNMEQMNPDPFMEKLKIHGLPWQIKTDDEINW